MIVLGLTGSIGMGKSTAAAMLRHLRVPVHDADATVHRLMAPGGSAVAPINAAFPGVVAADGSIDRPALRQRVIGHPEALAQLEAIVHPLVKAEKRRFLARHRGYRSAAVVLDVPLLYESGGDTDCDAVLVVSAPAFLQRQRVLRRPGMTEAILAAILVRQWPDAVKRRRADAVIPSGLGRAVTFRRLRHSLKKRRAEESKA